jgi:sucrose-phosphate synthase
MVLFRSQDLELGRDSDTGGQTLYVLELARSLALRPEVDHVDVVTRQIVDRRVSPDYALPEEANLLRGADPPLSIWTQALSPKRIALAAS